MKRLKVNGLDCSISFVILRQSMMETVYYRAIL